MKKKSFIQAEKLQEKIKQLDKKIDKVQHAKRICFITSFSTTEVENINVIREMRESYLTFLFSEKTRLENEFEKL